MLRKVGAKQTEMEMVTLEQLVPEDHLLRLIERHIEFGFIREKTEHLYSADNGRPAVDPVLMFKMLFIGYLYGVRSERQLVREVEVNVAYRWFLGMGLAEKVMDASTFSQNRRRRFSGTGIEQEIFDAIVEQAMRRGLVGGHELYSDSTLVRASANKNRKALHTVDVKPAEWLAELEAAVEEERRERGKKPLPAKKDAEPERREVTASPVDPDAGYVRREGKAEGFYYSDHRTVDGKCNIVLDVHVTSAGVHDSAPYLGRLARVEERFAIEPEAAGLDAAYNTPAICKGLVEAGIFGVVAYGRPVHKEGCFYKRQYAYDEGRDCYVCPAGERLDYRTTDREGYRHYAAEARACESCPLRGSCTKTPKGAKSVIRHLWEGFKEEVAANRKSERGGRILERRRETVERSFADAKTLHCHRWARYRGLAKVQGQALLSAACQNMKKIARVLAMRLGEPSLPPLQPLRALLPLAANSLLRFFRPLAFAFSN